MLRFIIILVLIYLFFRLGKVLLRWYLKSKIDSMKRENFKPPPQKFRDADDADFTDIIDPDKKKKNE